MALVADHFQYREAFHDRECDRAYAGPWQGHLRDIDPSCTLRRTRGGTSWGGHAWAWWGSATYENWTSPPDHAEWVKDIDDLPRVEGLLAPVHPDDGSQWLNVQGYFNWRQEAPVDQESIDVDRRELWYICTGYLIRAEDADALMAWAETVDFWGRWMPDPPEVHWMFLGEHI